ncbi:MAG: M42 family metallopeptidase [Tissierellia bacterium]|nr:M42 family metallopeptidase [Tissierellia bacterium]
MKDLTDYCVDILEELLLIPSPTGYANMAIDFVKKEFEKLDIPTKLTYKGALIATIEGNSRDALTFSGHVDTLGMMVKEIKPDGRLSFHRIGSYPFNTVEGEYVIVKTIDGREFTGTVTLNNSSVHVHPDEIAKGERSADTMSIKLDELVNSEEDTRKLGIEIGDFIFIDTRTVITESGFIKSRHLDDKAGVACILSLAKYLKDNDIKPEMTIHFLISNYEEVGHGACFIPENTKDFIAVDMAAPDTGQASKEILVTICAMDSSGPYDIDIRNKLIQIAKSKDIDYAVDIYPFYMSDGSAALRSGNDIKVGLIGPGVSNSHTFERTHRLGLENTIRLMIEYIKS